MTRDERVLARVDHTLLRPTATWEEIKELCLEAVIFETVSVCIPPCYVARAFDYLCELQLTKYPELERPAVCTVVGFPNGNTTTGVKCYEAEEAILNGAEEIDMMINLGWVKAGRYDLVEEEIRQIKEICKHFLLKVIVEACLLTKEEKIELCHIITRVGAEYIKTSTGFSTGGATLEDVALFVSETGSYVNVKAAGGIDSFDKAEQFLELGARRLGTSRLVAIKKAELEKERSESKKEQ